MSTGDATPGAGGENIARSLDYSDSRPANSAEQARQKFVDEAHELSKSAHTAQQHMQKHGKSEVAGQESAPEQELIKERLALMNVPEAGTIAGLVSQLRAAGNQADRDTAHQMLGATIGSLNPLQRAAVMAQIGSIPTA